MRPLGFLVADKNMEACLLGLFQRDRWWRSVGCAQVDLSQRDIHVAAGSADPGLYSRGAELLRPFSDMYDRMVVMVDAEWSGSPGLQAIQERMRAHLEAAGWRADRALALVFEPEVDLWLWTKTDHTAQALGWPSWRALAPALDTHHWWPAGEPKPPRPKEAAEWALSQKRRPRSSAIYQRITSAIGLKHCVEPAFLSLREALRTWFPVGPEW